jgi:hypothetical protein
MSTPSFSDRLSLTTKNSHSSLISYGPQAQPSVTQPAPYGKTKPLPDSVDFVASQPPLSDEAKISPIGILPKPSSDETKTSPIGILPQPTPPEDDASLVTTYTPSTTETQSTQEYWTLERMQQAKPMPMPTVPLMKNLISDNKSE